MILMAALIGVVACETTDEPAIDYSTWTIEELLASGDGVDFLVKNATEIDYEQLEAKLLNSHTLRFDYRPLYSYDESTGRWVSDRMFGVGEQWVTLLDKQTVRVCVTYDFYTDPALQWAIGYPVYIDYAVKTTPLEAVTDQIFNGSKFVAQVGEDIFIVEALRDGDRTVVTIHENRDEVLAKHATPLSEIRP